MQDIKLAFFVFKDSDLPYLCNFQTIQMNRSRREALDVSMKLEQTEHEKSRLHQDSNAALQDVSI